MFLLISMSPVRTLRGHLVDLAVNHFCRRNGIACLHVFEQFDVVEYLKSLFFLKRSTSGFIIKPYFRTLQNTPIPGLWGTGTFGAQDIYYWNICEKYRC